MAGLATAAAGPTAALRRKLDTPRTALAMAGAPREKNCSLVTGVGSQWACTKFTAVVEYTVANDTRRMRTGAGQSRGRDEPESEARYDVGDAFALRVHPATREALPDSTMGLWGLPIMLGIGGGLFAVFGLWGVGRRR